MWFLRSFIRNLFWRRQVEHDLDEEVRAHFELLVAQHRAEGLDEPGAHRAARLELGGAEQVKEAVRDVRQGAWFEGVWRDMRYGVRRLTRNPGFAVVSVTMLALGIGVNAAVFTLTDAVLFKGFPMVERNERLLYISNSYGCCVSYPDFEDWRAQATSFAGMAVVHGKRVTFSDERGLPESYDATEISADTFRLVGQRPALGRDFVAVDETPGAAPVALLSDGFWERRYGKDPTVIGRTVRINGVPTTVIGVMPHGFSFPQNQDLWVPLIPTPAVRAREARNLWMAFGRLADGVTVEQARAEIDTIGRRLAREYPRTNGNHPPIVQTFQQFFVGPNATLIYGALWGAVGFVLLICCANLANLMLSRAIGRSREMSVRISLGAGRWRIIRQLLIESLMLSSIGGLCGWWIAAGGVRAYALADRSWRILDYTMDFRVVAYLAAISIAAGLVFGLAPALGLSRLDINAALKDGGRGAAGGRNHHLSALLITGEIALAVVLLAGAGVMVRSFLKIYTADVGVKATNDVMAVPLSLPEARYRDASAQTAFVDALDARLAAVPGVESVAIASVLPTNRLQAIPYELAGAPPVDAQRLPTSGIASIAPAYFSTLGTTMLGGRAFTEYDAASGMPVAIVSQRFATECWPGESAVGKRLRLYDGRTPRAWLTIVGVAANILQSSGTTQTSDPLVYLPYRQAPTRSVWVYARTRVPPVSLVPVVRREIQAIDADLPSGPSGGLWTLADWLEWPHREQDNFTVMFVIFAAIALLLASVGLYAVVAHAVGRRTQEIGIRIAMGATAGDVLGLVFRQGMLPVGIGLGVGLAASFAVTPLLKSELVQVSPTDPLTLFLVAIVLSASAALGCWIPARRAMRVDPVVALRHD